MGKGNQVPPGGRGRGNVAKVSKSSPSVSWQEGDASARVLCTRGYQTKNTSYLTLYMGE